MLAGTWNIQSVLPMDVPSINLLFLCVKLGTVFFLLCFFVSDWQPCALCVGPSRLPAETHTDRQTHARTMLPLPHKTRWKTPSWKEDPPKSDPLLSPSSWEKNPSSPNSWDRLLTYTEGIPDWTGICPTSWSGYTLYTSKKVHRLTQQAANKEGRKVSEWLSGNDLSGCGQQSQHPLVYYFHFFLSFVFLFQNLLHHT